MQLPLGPRALRPDRLRPGSLGSWPPLPTAGRLVSPHPQPRSRAPEGGGEADPPKVRRDSPSVPSGRAPGLVTLQAGARAALEAPLTGWSGRAENGLTF